MWERFLLASRCFLAGQPRFTQPDKYMLMIYISCQQVLKPERCHPTPDTSEISKHAITSTINCRYDDRTLGDDFIHNLRLFENIISFLTRSMIL